MFPPNFSHLHSAIRTLSQPSKKGCKVCTRMWRIFCTWDAASWVTFVQAIIWMFGPTSCLSSSFATTCRHCFLMKWNKSVEQKMFRKNLVFFPAKKCSTWFLRCFVILFFGSNKVDKLTREIVVKILVSPFALCFKVSNIIIPHVDLMSQCFTLCPGNLSHPTPPNKNLQVP